MLKRNVRHAPSGAFDAVHETRPAPAGGLDAFREAFAAVDPGFEDRLAKNDWRRRLALALRGLRKSHGLDQVEIARRAALKQAQVSRIEQPSGPKMRIDTLAAYLLACDCRLVLMAEPVNGSDHVRLLGVEPDDLGFEATDAEAGATVGRAAGHGGGEAFEVGAEFDATVGGGVMGAGVMPAGAGGKDPNVEGVGGVGSKPAAGSAAQHLAARTG